MQSLQQQSVINPRLWPVLQFTGWDLHNEVLSIADGSRVVEVANLPKGWYHSNDIMVRLMFPTA